MAFPNMRTYAFDANALLSDNAAAYTVSGYAQAFGADGLLDLGGNQGATVTLPAIADVVTQTPQQPRIDAYLILDVPTIDISSGNETYQIDLMLSNDPAFAAGNVVCAGGVQLGKGAALRGAVAQKDSVIGRIEIGFTNQVCGNIFQFAKLFITCGGTTPSINLLAFVAVTPEP